MKCLEFAWQCKSGKIILYQFSWLHKFPRYCVIDSLGMVVIIFFLVASLLDPWLQPEGSYELGSVRPFFRLSVLPSFYPEVFSELSHKFFLKLSMVLEANVLLCVTEPGFSKNIFCPQNGENGPKIGFIGKFSH